MKSITVSDPVWQAIAGHGKFGETEDDVLRRIFRLPASVEADAEHRQVPRSAVPHRATDRRRSFATNKLSSYISGNELRVSFASGPFSSWGLPEKTDKVALRAMREKATTFAKKHGATVGQVNAVRKTLTEAGYHLLK